MKPQIFTQEERMLFRYAGSKRWLTDYLCELPLHERLCELYLGSGSMIFNTNSQGYGIEANPMVVSIYKWLATQTAESLRDLEKLRQSSFDSGINDIRKMALEEGAFNYIRVNCCGLFAGDFQSYKMYGKKFLPINDTIDCLEKLKRSEFVLGNATDYKERDGDLVFLDPPYLDMKKKEISHMLYKNKNYNPQDTVELIGRIKAPILFCYGSTAKEVFPMYDWHFVKSKKVGNVKKENTERSEYIAFINCDSCLKSVKSILED